jgi:enoyl-CoA hydratase/carnithine racemase
MSPTYQFMSYRVQDAIAEIVMSHPPVNAMTVELLEEILACFERAAADDSVHAIILGSAVPGRFCAGLDLMKFADGDYENTRLLVERLYTDFTNLQFRLGKPSIAAVNGTARGGGMTLSISCDMIVAERSATLGYPEIDVGLLPAIHFTHLPRIIGKHRAFDLLFTGRTFSPQEGFELGLVSRVVDDGTAMDEARALARVLTAKPRRILKMAREMFMREIDSDYRKGVAAAVENFASVAATPESKAEVRSFIARQSKKR